MIVGGLSVEDRQSSGMAAKKAKPRPRNNSAPEWFSADDLHLFNEGSYVRMYEKFGCHPQTRDGVDGAHFAVWAPGAESVAVIGTFNDWNPDANPLSVIGSSGIWGGFIGGATQGQCYK